MKRKDKIFSLIFLFFATAGLFAGVVPSVGFTNLSSSGIDETGVNTLENLIFDFLKEQRNINAVDLRLPKESTGQELPEIQTDYICTGSIFYENNKYYLSLTLSDLPNHEKTTEILKNYDSFNRILLESRTLLKELVESMTRENKAPSQTNDQTKFIPITNLDSLSGSWRGEEGIEKVVILRGGKAVVFFSTGISMQLELSLSPEGKLIAKQKGPNQVKYFMSLPTLVATKVAATAPPTSWELSLSEDKQSLIGTHFTIDLAHNGTDVISMEKISPRVVWNRE